MSIAADLQETDAKNESKRCIFGQKLQDLPNLTQRNMLPHLFSAIAQTYYLWTVTMPNVHASI